MPSSAILIMGVAGSGKSTIGRLLASRTGWRFIDADALHPPENVAKMAAGVPLTDADRWPWLDRVAAWIAERRGNGEPGIVACSALKHSYRDVLRKADPSLRIVHLDGDEALLRHRLAERSEHFFAPSLLDTQLADLEPPTADESAIIVPIGQTTERITESILAALTR